MAEAEGFEVFVTTDSNLKHQQRIRHLRLAIIVLTTTSWPKMQSAVEAVVQAIDRAEQGTYTEVRIP